MPQITCSNLENVIWAEPDTPSGGSYVHIYRLQLSANASYIEKARRLLSADEAARGERYLHQKDRTRFTLTRAALRLLLSRYTGISATSIEFVTDANKKPSVKEADIHYNVSHAGDWAAIGISDRPLGVDVEFKDSEYNYPSILDMCFSEEETLHIQNANNSLSAFYRLWTRKEALVKATAKGMDEDFKLAPSINGIHTVSQEIIGSKDDWQVMTLPLADQHIASLAYAPSIEHISFYEATELLKQL